MFRSILDPRFSTVDKVLRRVHPPAFKAKVALEAIKEQKTIVELSSIYGVHSTQIAKWKHRALAGLTQLFSDKWKRDEEQKDELLRALYEQIGKLKVEGDWLKKKIGLNSHFPHQSLYPFSVYRHLPLIAYFLGDSS